MLHQMLHELNLAIDNAFKEAGVTIAFPQRDVHLDATDPLEVRVVSDPAQPLKTDGVTKAQ
jgi:potassium efflux system protein